MKTCECGCGQATDICERTDHNRGWIKGEPKRFINGHALRLFDKPIKFTVDLTTGCWNWILYIRDDGYGGYKTDGKTYLAHKWVYEACKGVVLSKDDFLDHKCRNRKCVNPAHLEVVTFVENVRRGLRATITSEIAASIRQSYVPNVISQNDLAKKYGVTRSLIAAVVQNRTWK